MLKTLTWLVCACATLPVLAQTAAPSTEQMIEQLKAPRSRSLRTLIVEGHTDAQGSADYNRRLSQQRAQALRELLITSGVEDGRLMAAGKGSSELANRSQPLAAENRRVRIVNLD